MLGTGDAREPAAGWASAGGGVGFAHSRGQVIRGALLGKVLGSTALVPSFPKATFRSDLTVQGNTSSAL